jgi:cyclophilin family peptidyl-prolyl cis-trans isomerase
MRLIAALLALFGALFATTAFAQKESAAPAPAAPVAPPPATPDNIWVLELSTGGRVQIQLRPDKAPNHVERIKTLTRQGFYNGLTFHRVIDGFMAQGGDPKGTGEGGSTLPDLKAEFNDLPHVRGVASMARAEAEDSANSQFFIILMPTLRLDNRYTAFGRVISGMQYVDAIEKGEPPANPSRIVRAWIQADGENAPLVPAPAPVATPAPAPTPTPAPTPETSN